MYCVLQDVPAYLATSPLTSSENLMELGVREMKEKYLNDEGSHKQQYVTAAGNHIEVITKGNGTIEVIKEDDSGSDIEGKYEGVPEKEVTFILDEVAEELKKKKTRRKRKNHRKVSIGESSKVRPQNFCK